jgi:hypothetical protein
MYTVEVKDAYGHRIHSVQVEMGKPFTGKTVGESVLIDAARGDQNYCDLPCEHCNPGMYN